jgi:hypothetical protein
MVANTRTTPHRDPRRRHPARRRRGGSSIPVAGFTSAPPTRTGTARFSQPVSPQNAAPTANKLLPPTSEMCPLEPVLGLFVRTAAHAVPVCSGAAGFGFGAAPATPAVVRAAADARAAIRLRIVSPLICRPGRRLPPLLRGGYSEHKLRGDRQADPDHEPAERARPGPPSEIAVDDGSVWVRAMRVLILATRNAAARSTSPPTPRLPCRMSESAAAASASSGSDGDRSSMNRCSQRRAARSNRCGSVA